MKTIVALIGLGLLVPISAALAEQPIVKHMDKQERRIDQGVNSGRLTDKEAERLQNQQEIIQKERGNALEDGKITRGERKEIRHDQRKASHNIRRKKHNDRKE
jgi:hypothetical protein